MQFLNFQQVVIYFFIYSVMGYICEVVYCSSIQKKLVNRGFLNGPYCPIYGFGAIIVLFAIAPFKANPVILFIVATIVTSAVEYFSHWLLQKTFKLTWWDYSKYKYNLNGRICLKNSILFGLLSLVLIYFVEPVILSFVSPLSITLQRYISTGIMVLLGADFLITLNTMINLEQRLKELANVLNTLGKYKEKYSGLITDTKTLKEIAIDNNDVMLIKTISNFENLTSKAYGNFRILRSYPRITHERYTESINVLKISIKNKFELANKKIALTLDIASKKVTYTVDELTAHEDDGASFAAGFNFYKMFWMFFVSAFLGNFIETVFVLISSRTFQSRQGVLYGPFSPLYGAGAVLFLLILHKLAKYRDAYLFFACALLGGLFEIVANYFAELIFNITYIPHVGTYLQVGNGRTSLIYMFFWGILGVFIIKDIYPKVSNFVEKVPNYQGYIISWVTILFMVYNMSVTAVTITRWISRNEGDKSDNAFEAVIDEHFTDEYMSEIFPYLIVGK